MLIGLHLRCYFYARTRGALRARRGDTVVSLERETRRNNARSNANAWISAECDPETAALRIPREFHANSTTFPHAARSRRRRRRNSACARLPSLSRRANYSTRRTPRILMRALLIALMPARGSRTSLGTSSLLLAHRHALADAFANPSFNEKPTKGETRRANGGIRGARCARRYIGILALTRRTSRRVLRRPNSVHLALSRIRSVSFRTRVYEQN